MADIRTFFASLDGSKRRKAGAAGPAGADIPPVPDARGPCSILSWNCDGMDARNEDGKLKTYLQEEQIAIPDLVALQETWAAWDTCKRGDLRRLLYAPRQQPTSPAEPTGLYRRDSLGLDDIQEEFQGGEAPAVNITGSLDPHTSRLLPSGWAENLPHGYWSCCSYKRRAGVGVLSRIEPLSVEWRFPGMAIAFAAEGRYICLEFERYFVVNLYVPNTGTDRLDARATGWETPLRSHLGKLDAKKPVILLGDFNVSHTALDLTHPDFMATSGRGRGVYAPQAGVRELEREGFSRLLREGGIGGFVDVFRDREPTNRQCSWRGSHSRSGNRARYAGMGMRLDYVSRF